jgi:hypothetical protein
MSDQVRKEFEEWAEKCNEAGKIGYISLLKTKNNLHYIHKNTSVMWSAWQASRQTLVVELPKVHDEPYADDYTRAFIDGKKSIIEEVHDAVDKAGVSYK